MPISVDSSTVALFSGTILNDTESLVSASFTPAAGDLLVCAGFIAETNGADPPTFLSIAGGGLNWNQIAVYGYYLPDAGPGATSLGFVSLSIASVKVSASMTVTIRRRGASGNVRTAGKVLIVSGAGNRVGARVRTEFGSDPTNQSVTAEYRGILIGAGNFADNSLTAPTSTDQYESVRYPGVCSFIVAWKDTIHSPGGSPSLNFANGGAPQGNYVVAEIADGSYATVTNLRG